MAKNDLDGFELHSSTEMVLFTTLTLTALPVLYKYEHLSISPQSSWFVLAVNRYSSSTNYYNKSTLTMESTSTASKIENRALQNCGSCSSISTSRKKFVSFSDIEIIELPYSIGDGPASGAPLSVGWDVQDRSLFSIDFFEYYRPQRRTKQALRLPDYFREQL